MRVQRFAIDWKASFRTWLRSPGLALVAVLALAMGVGATTTMFSIVHGATRDLPFANPDQLVMLSQRRASAGDNNLGARAFDVVEWRRGLQSLQGLAAFSSRAVNVSDDVQRPERVSAAAITPNAFALLGDTPLLGRALSTSDEQTPVVVLGHDLWRSRYGADSNIVGRVLRLDGEARTVVGVMRAGFGFPLHAQLWTPLAISATSAPDSREWIEVFGRLREGSGISEARAELAAMSARLATAYPASHEKLRAVAFPFTESELPPEIRRLLRIMLIAVSFLLVIACANVANALLARAVTRSGEVAIRTALGASRGRIVGQHLLESVVLAAFGGALGVLVAWYSVGFFASSVSNVVEAFWMSFRIDGTVLLYAVAVTGLAAVFAGILPALRSASTDPADALRSQSSGGRLRLGRASRALVATEFALAGGLLVLAVTFVRTAVAMRSVAFPFDIDHVATAQLGVPWREMSDTARRNAVVRAVAEEIRSIPGVTASALVTTLPGRGAGADEFTLAGTDNTETRPRTGFTAVTPEFFALAGAQPLRGRLLTWSDDERAQPVLVVNVSFVRLHAGNGDPVGRQITFGRTTYTIVGLVPDLMMQDVDSRRGDGVYISLLQSGPSPIRIMTRGPGNPASLLPSLHDAVERVDASLPLLEPMALRDAIYADKKILEAFATLFFGFGLGALFMTTIGLYGVISFAVSRRAREIAIRQALGAGPRDVLRLVLRQGSVELSAGIGIGVALAYGLSRALAAGMEAAQPAGPAVLLSIAAVLSATALLAMWRPTSRALGLPPVQGLRGE